MQKLKKIYIDSDSIITTRPSGIGSMTVQLIRALSQDNEAMARYRIVLLCPFNKTSLLQQWKFNSHVSVWPIPLTGRMISGLLRIGLLPPIDMFAGKGIYVFPNFRNFPLLQSQSLTYIHDISFITYPQFVEKKNLAFLQRNVNRWIKRADRVITVSNHAKTEIVKHYPEALEKIDVIYNGLTADFTPLEQAATSQLVTRYGLKYKEYFMFLSNLEPRKNVEGLLSAYREFIKEQKHTDVKLLMVGGMGWKNEKMLEIIREINADEEKVILPIHYVPDEELPGLLSGAAALLHPAFYEGFGISPLQAMACGTQVLVGNNTSLPEVVGEAGIYVDADDKKDILKGMQQVYARRYECNIAGIKRAKLFSWQRGERALVSIIDELR